MTTDTSITRRPPNAFVEFWHYFSMNKGAVLGLVVVILLILTALFAP
ncbi:MAG TPA: dipeptide ABC transporter permease DppC, partial [Devosia sp.]|nr:dipeptide ABC transporter permease DppC [Devosia sp.]